MRESFIFFFERKPKTLFALIEFISFISRMIRHYSQSFISDLFFYPTFSSKKMKKIQHFSTINFRFSAMADAEEKDFGEAQEVESTAASTSTKSKKKKSKTTTDVPDGNSATASKTTTNVRRRRTASRNEKFRAFSFFSKL